MASARKGAGDVMASLLGFKGHLLTGISCAVEGGGIDRQPNQSAQFFGQQRTLIIPPLFESRSMKWDRDNDIGIKVVVPIRLGQHFGQTTGQHFAPLVFEMVDGGPHRVVFKDSRRSDTVDVMPTIC